MIDEDVCFDLHISVIHFTPLEQNMYLYICEEQSVTQVNTPLQLLVRGVITPGVDCTNIYILFVRH